jgi:hypothetical protein
MVLMLAAAETMPRAAGMLYQVVLCMCFLTYVHSETAFGPDVGSSGYDAHFCWYALTEAAKWAARQGGCVTFVYVHSPAEDGADVGGSGDGGQGCRYAVSSSKVYMLLGIVHSVRAFGPDVGSSGCDTHFCWCALTEAAKWAARQGGTVTFVYVCTRPRRMVLMLAAAETTDRAAGMLLRVSVLLV